MAADATPCGAVPAHPARGDARPRCWPLVLLLAVVAPILWARPGRRDRHRARSCRAARPRTGSAPTTSAATSSTAVLVATRLSVVLALAATAIGGRRSACCWAPRRACSAAASAAW